MLSKTVSGILDGCLARARAALRPAAFAGLALAGMMVGAPHASADSITTLFTAGNGLGNGAIVYFDLSTTAPMTITMLDVNVSSTAGTAVTVDVFTTAAGQSYASNMTNAGAWTQVATGSGSAAGANLPTSIDISDFQLPAGSYGIGIRYTMANGNASYTNGNGTNQSYTNGTVSLTLGASQATPWTSTPFTPRVWNGTIYYSLGSGTTTGACCTATAQCTFVTLTACSSSGGFFSGANTSCSPNVCPHRGSCCSNTTNACTLSNNGSAGCASGTTYQGDATTCSPNVCPQGACCNFTSGACTLTAPGGCISPNTYQSNGSVCSPSPCPQGACCNPASGACTLTASAGCTSPNTYQSDGTTCTPNPCPQPPPPSNDDCSAVLTALSPVVPPSGGTVSGSNAGATTDGNVSCGTGGFRDVYFAFTPAASGTYTFDLCQTVPSFDTVLSVHSGCPADTSTVLGCNDDSCGLLSSVQLNNFTAGTHYIVRVSSYSNADLGGPFVLNVVFNVSGACCNSTTGACTISTTGASGCSGGTYNGDNTACTATSCPGIGTCCAPTGNCSVLYGGSCPSGQTANAAIVCSPTLCPQAAGTVCQNFDFGSSLPSGWTSLSSGAGADWAISTAQVHSAPNSAFTNDVASVSSQFLTLPTFTADSSGMITFDFFSYYQTEATFDGFVLEYSTDGGGSWNDITSGGTWTLNAYNQAAISTAFQSPIAGRAAFSGVGTSWTEHIATLPTTTGQQVMFRFQMASDSSVASTGVWIDDVCVSGLQIQGASGVCCRGATCSTTVAQGSCTGGGTAGATFVSSASNCNSAGSTTTPCCYANYNKVNGITVQDIFDFLNDWFAGSPYARTGGNGAAGALAVQNIFDFLNAWFAGGCS